MRNVSIAAGHNIEYACVAEITKRDQVNATLTRLNHAIAKSPKLARLYIERGDIYYQLKEFQRVIENYSAPLKLDDTQSKAYFVRGMGLWTDGPDGRGIA